MDDWEKFNEAPLPEKEELYSNLNIEDITDADYMHACMQKKKNCEDFEIKNCDLYIKSDALLLADVSKNFRKMSLKIYYLDPAQFFSTSGLAWKAALKKTEVKLELLTGIDMLFMIEKRIKGGMFQAIHQYAKANNKYWDVFNIGIS